MRTTYEQITSSRNGGVIVIGKVYADNIPAKNLDMGAVTTSLLQNMLSLQFDGEPLDAKSIYTALIWMANITKFTAVNEAYRKLIPSPYPSRFAAAHEPPFDPTKQPVLEITLQAQPKALSITHFAGPKGETPKGAYSDGTAVKIDAHRSVIITSGRLPGGITNLLPATRHCLLDALKIIGHHSGANIPRSQSTTRLTLNVVISSHLLQEQGSRHREASLKNCRSVLTELVNRQYPHGNFKLDINIQPGICLGEAPIEIQAQTQYSQVKSAL